MRFSILPALLLAGTGVTLAASSWNFDEAILSVTSKGAGQNNLKDKLSDHAPLTKPVVLGSTDSLKIILTATEDGTSKRPHQAMLLLRDQDTGVEDAFVFTVKDSGKARVEVSQKDLPYQLLTSTQPLRATLLLASFGSVTPFGNHVFNLDVKLSSSAPPLQYNAPERLRAKPLIDHIFKADPKNPPKIISIFFTLVVVATLPALFGTWLYFGANLDHAPAAFSAAPMSHSLFFGSIVAMEGLFFLYYTHWTLFKVLPVASVIGVVMFLSGSRALSEVQKRRLAGER